MRIEISNDPVEFVMGGMMLASFDFYELEERVDEEYAKEKADPAYNAGMAMRDWMIERGLPDTVNIAAVNTWLLHYMRALDAETKKTIGQ